jgi:radical SAM-linked protein
MNRLRVRFGRGDELKYISHLDLTRLWHRALRRAGIAIAYSEGFNPHPRLSLAAPLQLGVTSDAELMDVITTQQVTPPAFASLLKAVLPEGVSIYQVFNVPLNIPALQSQLTFADYTVMVGMPEGFDLEVAVSSLLARVSIPWHHQRDTGLKSYDLRPLISVIKVVSRQAGFATLDMRLRCGTEGTGRPEQVVKALGLDNPLSIHRNLLTRETTHG